MNYFDEKYRIQPAFIRNQSCASIGEHHGDATVVITGEPEALERWSCCGETEVVGEVFDCDDCLEPGIRPHGQDLPPGWIEDTNGFHCHKCTPKEWRNAA